MDDYPKREALRLLPERRATYDKKRSLCRHLRLGFQCHVRSVTTAMVRDYLAKPCLRLALSPKTLSDLVGELRYLLRDAQIRGVIVHPPPVPSIQVPKTPIQWLDLEARDQVLRLIPETHRPIFGFLFLYGCRMGEACALCWDQIDVENGAFYLARTFSRRRLSQTNKTKRLAPLPVQPEFVEVLEEAARDYRIRDQVPTEELPVFVNPEAHPSKNPHGFYLPDFLNSLWTAAVSEAGLNPIPRKNATRHSRAMQYLNAGLDLSLVARLLTHTGTTHVRRYARHQVDSLRRAIDQTRSNVRPLHRRKDN